MFDTTIVAPARAQRTHIDIHEHRAPTDESVKLLSEFEEAARAKVEQSIRLDSNELKGVLHLERDCLNNQLVCRVHVSLNGRPVKIEARQAYDTPPRDILLKVRDEVARAIAAEAINTAFSVDPTLLRALEDRHHG